MPLWMHQNTPFQVKNPFLWGRGTPSPHPIKPSGSASVPRIPARFTPLHRRQAHDHQCWILFHEVTWYVLFEKKQLNQTPGRVWCIDIVHQRQKKLKAPHTFASRYSQVFSQSFSGVTAGGACHPQRTRNYVDDCPCHQGCGVSVARVRILPQSQSPIFLNPRVGVLQKKDSA